MTVGGGGGDEALLGNIRQLKGEAPLSRHILAHLLAVGIPIGTVRRVVVALMAIDECASSNFHKYLEITHM